MLAYNPVLWTNPEIVDDLTFIVEFMRDLSRQTDPQIAANLYGKRLREGKFFPADAFMALSRRDWFLRPIALPVVRAGRRMSIPGKKKTACRC